MASRSVTILAGALLLGAGAAASAREGLRPLSTTELLNIPPGPSAESPITVQAPLEQLVGRSYSGAPLVQYSASVTVDLSDLDLASLDGRQGMRTRVIRAGRQACSTIERRHPFLVHDGSDCSHDAVKGALGHADRMLASGMRPSSLAFAVVILGH